MKNYENCTVMWKISENVLITKSLDCTHLLVCKTGQRLSSQQVNNNKINYVPSVLLILSKNVMWLCSCYEFDLKVSKCQGESKKDVTCD